MKRIVKIILISVVSLITVTFTLLNSQRVNINFYFGHYEIDLLVVVVISLVAGAALGIVAALGRLLVLKQEVMRKEKKIKTMEKEVENLRSLPIKDDR